MREQSCWILLKKVLSEAVLKRLGGLSCSCLRPCGYRVSRTQTVGLHKCALWGIGGVAPDVNTLCFKGPFGGIGASPLMSTRCASRAGEFVA